MKKVKLLFLLAISIFTLGACEKEVTCLQGQELNEKSVCVDIVVVKTCADGEQLDDANNCVAIVVEQFTVTFDTDGGTDITAVKVDSGSTATAPTEPTKEGYSFTMWYSTDDTIDFDFATAITEDVTVNAYWTEIVPGVTNEELIQQDIDYLTANLMVDSSLVDAMTRGKVNRSYVSWSSDNKYVSSNGIVLPLPEGSDPETAQITATFKLTGVEVTHTFDVPLVVQGAVTLATTREVPFENLTTEYDVADANVNLMFEDGGEVPYIKLTDFFDLLDGFIDPETVFIITNTDGVLTIQYDYYDEDEDYTYELILTVDSNENTVGVNDPGFFYAYMYSIETNYGRHIEYMDDTYPGYDFQEGTPISYDLDEYSMDVVSYNDEVYLPYYIANQLFAGSSYYNVYYNYDGLYGIYAIPGSDSDEMATIRDSFKNRKDIPVDMVIHNFNMLAFNLDSFYGLKDIKDVDSYYDELYDRKEEFLSQKITTFENELFDFIFMGLDDPHTSYRLSSFYNSTSASGPTLTAIEQLGTRQRAMYETDGYWDVGSAVDRKWGSAEARPDYWFLDTESVVITLDGFVTVDMEVSDAYDKTLVEEVLEVTDADTIIPPVTDGTKFWYYKSSTLDENILELLVKDVDESYVATYEAALVNLGATALMYQATEGDDTSNIDYYTLTVGDVTYMIYVTYDTEYDVFYVNVMNTVDTEMLSDIDTAYSVNADNGVYLELIFDQILAEQPLLENVTLDLTNNGGGNIGALYRVLGFVTDDPYGVSKIDRDTYGYSTSYVDIDDGIPSYAYLNWSLLTTQLTYSAANEMVAIFITEDLGDIIGMKTGGGACSITPVLLPSGTAFTMSSNSIGATRTGEGTEESPYVYSNTEFGFEPDYPLTLGVIYDADTLLAIVNPTE